MPKLDISDPQSVEGAVRRALGSEDLPLFEVVDDMPSNFGPIARDGISCYADFVSAKIIRRHGLQQSVAKRDIIEYVIAALKKMCHNGEIGKSGTRLYVLRSAVPTSSSTKTGRRRRRRGSRNGSRNHGYKNAMPGNRPSARSAVPA